VTRTASGGKRSLGSAAAMTVLRQSTIPDTQGTLKHCIQLAAPVLAAAAPVPIQPDRDRLDS